jgi:chemotaxis protein MotA
MSLASLLGVLAGMGLVVWSIIMSTDNPMVYADMHAFLMVIGGAIAAAFMGFHSTNVFTAFKACWWMFKKPKSTHEGLNTEIMRLIKWGYIVQQKGLPALEAEIRSVKANDPVIKYCLELVVTAHKPEELRDMMTIAVEAEFQRQTIPVQVLKSMSNNAPAFGMLGTLVGLVAVLASMGADAANMLANVGKGMALALTATLYGVFVARMVFMPAAAKLQESEETERFRNLMIVEGLVMLAEKRTPRYMQDKLNSFLHPSNHFNIDRQLGKA